VAELPELPESWVETLTGGELAAEAEIEAEVDQADIDRVLTDGEPCPAVWKVLDQYPTETEAGKAHHDAMVSVQLQLLRLGEQGHRGVDEAIGRLSIAFEQDRGDVRDTREEWLRAFYSGLGKVMAKPTEDHKRGCCSTKKREHGSRAPIPVHRRHHG
jgi:hypothetical protein